ncbi:carboxypeptidase A1-like [Lissotriton helveticus]
MRALVVFAALLMGAFGQKLFMGDQVLRIRADDEQQLAKIKELEDLENLQIDFWREPAKPSLPVDIRVPFRSLQAVKVFLESNNIAYTIMIVDVQALVDQEQEEMKISDKYEQSTKNFDFASYHTLNEIYAWMDTLVAKHPALITKRLLGHSFEGRPLYVLQFSRDGSAKRPAIWLDMGIHAREWITHATGIWTANKIAEDNTKDQSLKTILDKLDIFVLLVTNPDGYVYTHTTNRMWRKTRSVRKGTTCVGADPNRNWNAGWGGSGSSSNPCSETYHGVEPHSEPEIKALVDFISNHGMVKAMLTIHSYSQMLLFPYGYKSAQCPDHNELNNLAKVAADALAQLHNTKYTYGTTIDTIYKADGTTTDWAYDAGIKYSYTFELRDTGRYGFLLPANQILPTAHETWQALMKMMEHTRDNS